MAAVLPTTVTHVKKILLIDDDPELRQLLATYLGRQGYDTLLLPDTRQLDAFLERYQPQLLILDLMLPGEDGLSACRRLRGRGEARPIIMLTARDEPVDRVIGLEMGADDYLGKPFDPRELVARIEAVLRRGGRPPASEPQRGTVRFGEWLFDRSTRQLLKDGCPVALTSGEFALLNVLVTHANQTMKRERLIELTRREGSDSFDRAIDVQIHRLRRLLESDPAQPRFLQTVWGVGYVFVPDAASEAAAPRCDS
ncbi:MAG TPA: response regulator [Accumulibacter sp.]|uniref:response regulator n=1 Tax=Accumulibacter sp. TaxID=2053492 RepID=UPI00287AA5E9|nr:response regulator [Accumulibacter sp.]MDS4056668.1 response regulator [Accumulibacter sp.]HMV05794.1 response regulator [Accumulibacter sp.]HMW63277.1 response regulator [Accumulibacter sp.]HMW79212.1 response regulator [Accumulibacter sp.]HMX67401.1 response regulator [Accumulibacter sp.]